jgi:D-alanyl-D-alanine carboxypeptidase/D-alanyl-D-alanine-endopeptidase (penicillin-binding protein 4)
MRRLTAALGALLTVAALVAGTSSDALARSAQIALSPQQALTKALNKGMREVGNYSGAYVLDLTTGQVLYAHNARVGRLPASVEKLYTTSTALQEFGPDATLTTSVLGVGQVLDGTFTGTLYLRGGGDPTFGSASFDEANYGTGATIQRLVAALVHATGIKQLNGNIVADESMFDSLRGTPATGYAANIEVEGELSALAFNAGLNASGTALVAHPALEAGQQFAAALRSGGVKLPHHVSIHAGLAPPGAQPLASVSSPPMAALVALTNAPSDNFFAETLLKDLGARYGGGGTTADGAAVVRSVVAKSFGLHPRFNDGSGLSRYDSTTPVQVVSLLRQQAHNVPFTNSLAIAGETGTLQDEMRGTYAQGRCHGKTGTLNDVSNVAGYCQARDGNTLAYAFLMNGIYPDYAHPIQDQMQVALAQYNAPPAQASQAQRKR